MALDGHSFFFTGSAGTGKSLLLREIVRSLRAIHGSDGVHVTASTGVAACNIGGVTIHSFAGMGLAAEDAATLARRASDNRNTRARWEEARVLLIDEISMLSGDFFEKLEHVARKVRGCERPFGGLQVILCGDFFQLPPVTKSGEPSFCFEASSWNSAMQRCVELRSVYRQKDPQFVEILNEARVGTMAQRNLATLLQCKQTTLSTTDGIEPTRLYSKRKDVDEENMKFLRNLSGNSVRFKAMDSGQSYFLQQLQKNCPAPEINELKLGAQVILMKNLDVEKELVNGARGVIVDWQELDEEELLECPDMKVFPVVKFSSGIKRVIQPEEWSVNVGGEKMAIRRQIPLALAWALSIHKSQGMTIDKLEVSLGEVFEWGQAYVALSRATSISSLKILGDFDARVFKTHPKVSQFYKSSISGVFHK